MVHGRKHTRQIYEYNKKRKALQNYENELNLLQNKEKRMNKEGVTIPISISSRILFLLKKIDRMS